MTVTNQAGPIETNVAARLYRDVHKESRRLVCSDPPCRRDRRAASGHCNEERAVHIECRPWEMLEGRADARGQGDPAGFRGQSS